MIDFDNEVVGKRAADFMWRWVAGELDYREMMHCLAVLAAEYDVELEDINDAAEEFLSLRIPE